jgi:hypothetical protein
MDMHGYIYIYLDMIYVVITLPKAGYDIWKQFGMLEKTISDRGTVFNNKFIQAVYKCLGIDPHFSLAYHPKSNGQTKQVNPTIEHFLRAYASLNQSDWVK